MIWKGLLIKAQQRCPVPEAFAGSMLLIDKNDKDHSS